MPGLVFDCDGVLIDSEHTWHLDAFNQVWREYGVPWRWTPQEYSEMLAVAGGKERLDRLYTVPAFRAAVAVPEDRQTWLEWVAAWHTRKTEIYVARVLAEDTIAARPGVRRLAADAVLAGWRLAVASSGSRAAVTAVVRKSLGPALAQACTVVTADSVRPKKPAPDVYLDAVAALGLSAGDCVAVEDSRQGLLAATAAGLACVVTPVRHTEGHDFTEADLVVSSLGDPAGPEADVVRATGRGRPGPG